MGLQQSAFVDATNVYENSLEETFKKENGIFYTDVALADKIIKELKIVGDPIILDPCCGTGSFVFSAKKYGYSHVYGIDQDKSAIDFCIANIPSATFVAADSIGKTPTEMLKLLGIDKAKKVDYIVGNPPYVPIAGDVVIDSSDYLFKRKVSDSGNNLFVAALVRSMQLLNDGGMLSYIIPKNFLHVTSYSLLRREILKEKTIVSIIDIGAYFKNVRGEQIILTIKNTTPSKNKIAIKKLSSNRFVTLVNVDQSFYKDEILLFNSSTDVSIYKKLFSSYQKLDDLKNGYVGRGKSKSDTAVTGKDIRKFGYKDRDIPLSGSRIFIQNIYSAEAGVIAAFGGTMEASQTVTIFTDGDPKMCRYILGILHSRLCNFFLFKYCYNYSKLTMHTDAKYLKKIPLPKQDPIHFDNILTKVSRLEKEDYMSQDWFDGLELLNQAVYAAYGITQKESEYINCEMKRIQSKRWLNNG